MQRYVRSEEGRLIVSSAASWWIWDKGGEVTIKARGWRRVGNGARDQLCIAIWCIGREKNEGRGTDQHHERSASLGHSRSGKEEQ